MNTNAESLDLRRKFDDCWDDVDIPSLSSIFSGSETVPDDDLGAVLDQDLNARELHRVRIVLEDYLEAVPDLARRPSCATKILVREIRYEKPENLADWARERKSTIENFDGAIDAAVELMRHEKWPVFDVAVERRYRIVEALGAGGFGTVYRAFDAVTGKWVALKVLHIEPDDPMFDEALKRFRREADVLNELSHESIARVLDIQSSARPPFLTLELVEGCNLEFWAKREQRIRLQRPFSYRREVRRIERGVALVISAARAVDHAHRNGVLHRDLKPDNILRPENDRPMVVDFGLAALMADAEEAPTTAIGRTSLRDFRGAAQFSAPEGIPGRRRRRLDPRADVYALGAVLYSWLTLRPPFVGNTRREIMNAVERDEPPSIRDLNPHVSPGLEAVVRRAMAKHVDDRYESAAMLAGDLELVTRGEEPLIRPLGLGYRIKSYWQRDPGLNSALAGILLVLVAGVVTSLYFLGKSRESEAFAKAEAGRAAKASEQSQKDAAAARESERIAREALEEKLAADADVARKNGDWRRYFVLTERRINQLADPPAVLRLDCLRIASAVQEPEIAAREIAALSNMKLDDREAALLDLLKGESDFINAEDRKSARALIRRAIDSKKLTNADESYAVGLLEPRTTGAISAFKRAIEFEPTHRWARMGLAYTYLCCGDTASARREAAAIQAIYPNDVFPLNLGVLCAVVDGENSEITRELDLLRQRSGDDVHRIISGIVVEIQDGLKVVRDAFEGRQSPNIQKLLDVFGRMRKLSFEKATVRGMGFETAAVARFEVAMTVFRESFDFKNVMHLFETDYADELASRHPDTLFLILAAGAHGQEAARMQQEGVAEDIIERKLVDVYQRTRAATQAFSLAPKARVMALLAFIGFANIVRNVGAERRPTDVDRELFSALLELTGRRDVVKDDWKKLLENVVDPPFPTDCYRIAIAGFRRSSPTSVEPNLYEARLEIREGNLKRARKLLADAETADKTSKMIETIRKELARAESSSSMPDGDLRNVNQIGESRPTTLPTSRPTSAPVGASEKK